MNVQNQVCMQSIRTNVSHATMVLRMVLLCWLTLAYSWMVALKPGGYELSVFTLANSTFPVYLAIFI